MKKLYFKIPAITAVLLTLATIYTRIADYTVSYVQYGSFPFYGNQLGEQVIEAAFLLYALDAVFSLVKITKKIHPWENAITVLLFIGTFFALKYLYPLPSMANETVEGMLKCNFFLIVTSPLLLPQIASLLQRRKSRRAERENECPMPKSAHRMKAVCAKLPAMIAVLLSFVCLCVGISVYVMYQSEHHGGCIASPSRELVETGRTIAGWAGVFFLIEALFSVIKAFLGKHSLFHGLFAFAILVLLPLPYGIRFVYREAAAMVGVLTLLSLVEAISILWPVLKKKRACVQD